MNMWIVRDDTAIVRPDLERVPLGSDEQQRSKRISEIGQVKLALLTACRDRHLGRRVATMRELWGPRRGRGGAHRAGWVLWGTWGGDP